MKLIMLLILNAAIKALEEKETYTRSPESNTMTPLTT
jgi:hypothetical protein